MVGKQQAEDEPAVCPGEGSSIVGGMNRGMDQGEHYPPLLSTARTHPDTARSVRPPSTGKALTNSMR